MPFIGNIGAPELIIIAIIALVIFGPGKLPEVAQSLGRGVREFRKAATDVSDAASLDPGPPTPTAASTVPPVAPAPVAPAPVASPPVGSAPAPSAPADAPTSPATTPAEPPQGDAGQPST
jgi:sec-independent protein translocase protein TatA